MEKSQGAVHCLWLVEEYCYSSRPERTRDRMVTGTWERRHLTGDVQLAHSDPWWGSQWINTLTSPLSDLLHSPLGGSNRKPKGIGVCHSSGRPACCLGHREGWQREKRRLEEQMENVQQALGHGLTLDASPWVYISHLFDLIGWFPSPFGLVILFLFSKQSILGYVHKTYVCSGFPWS